VNRMQHDAVLASQRARRSLAWVLATLLVSGSVVTAVLGTARVEAALARETTAVLAAHGWDGLSVVAAGRTVTVAGSVASEADLIAVADTLKQQVSGLDSVTLALDVAQPVINPQARDEEVAAEPPVEAPAPVGSAALLTDPVIVHFATGAVHLTDTEKDRLRPVAKALRNAAPGSIWITGYVSLPHDGDQQFHSLQRAQAVADYLIRHGVPKDALIVRGRGAADPVASNHTEAGRLQNQRVVMEER